MYQALYREYRPEVFEDVIGQETIVEILKNQIEEDTVSHAYLFCGTRGTGKTTMARLLAKGVNCLSDSRPCGVCENCKSIQKGTFIDLIEIDAASNNGVGDIRELRESVSFPAVMGRKKVYIIDEVHALSKEAFNAFLKTLEEPPENVMFVLATTEPQKLPQTILSRCLRMDFRRVREKELADRMETICQNKNIKIDRSTLMLVASNADGSVRDGLTLLDQCISGRKGEITREDVLNAIGAVGEDTYISMTEHLLTGQVSKVVIELNEILEVGKDTRQVAMGMVNHFRNLLLLKYIENPEEVMNMSIEKSDILKKQSDNIELWQLDLGIMTLAQTIKEMQNTTQPRIILEVSLIKLGSMLIGQEINTSNKSSVKSKDIKIDLSQDTEVQNEKKDNIKTYKISEDGEKIWQDALDELSKDEFGMQVSKNVYVVGAREEEISIIPNSPAAKVQIEKNLQKIQDSIFNVYGKRLAIRIIEDDGNIKIDEAKQKSKIESIVGVELRNI